MRIVRRIFYFILLLFFIVIIWLNLKLYSTDNNQINERNDIIFQLNFLQNELRHNQLGKRMQDIFPEGFVFTNALYGLAWCEIGKADSSEINKKIALEEALFAYESINSKQATYIFDESLNPRYGIFYSGWKNYLLSKIFMLDSTFEQHEKYEEIYLTQCDEIADAVKNNKLPYLQSYSLQSWPADVCVAMASLQNHDKIFVPKYQTIIQDWISNVRLNLDPKTKLIPHKVNSQTGTTIEGARGCSISLIIRFLAEIDSNFAKQQYVLYKKYFVSTTLGLPSINEYPNGKFGLGDIDSGPVILGVGFSGTIVSIGTHAMMGEKELADQQYKTINAFGLSTNSKSKKKYIFGLIPIADAFIAWSRASGMNSVSSSEITNQNWRIKFHLISLAIILIGLAILNWRRISRSLSYKN